MRTGPLDVLLAAVVASGFAAVGEIVLRRSSRTLAEWNASLVTGLGACAALLFPLSVVVPRLALSLTLGLMGACVPLCAWRHARSRSHHAPLAAAPTDAGVRIPLVVASAAFLAFVALDVRYNLLWDGFAIWASKAQRLFVEGGLTPTWYPGESYDSRYVAYPSLIPLYEALVSRLRGRFDFDGLKPIFLVFHLSMAASAYSAVRVRASRRLAAWAAAILLLLPALSTQWAAGAYADMPLSAVVAAVVAGAMRSDAAALPWVIGALTTVKPEGLVLALLASAAVMAAHFLRKPRPRAGALLRGAAIVAAFVAVRAGYVRWTGARDHVYAFESLGLSLSRVPAVARLVAGEILNPAAWGLLWPAFAAASWILWRRGSTLERAMTAATAAGLVAMAGPFLFTTWPLELHFEQAYSRLLAQLAPAAVVVVVLAYARLREALEAGAPAVPRSAVSR